MVKNSAFLFKPLLQQQAEQEAHCSRGSIFLSGLCKVQKCMVTSHSSHTDRISHLNPAFTSIIPLILSKTLGDGEALLLCRKRNKTDLRLTDASLVPQIQT